MAMGTNSNNGKVTDFHQRGCIPHNKPSNNSNNGNKSICTVTRSGAGALISCHCAHHCSTVQTRGNRDEGYSNGNSSSQSSPGVITVSSGLTVVQYNTSWGVGISMHIFETIDYF